MPFNYSTIANWYETNQLDSIDWAGLEKLVENPCPITITERTKDGFKEAKAKLPLVAAHNGAGRYGTSATASDFGMLRLDLDGVIDQTPDTITEKLNAAHIEAFILYSTVQHDPVNAPRYRVLVPLAEPVPFKTWVMLQQHLAKLFEGPGLDNCVNTASQFMILPAKPDSNYIGRVVSGIGIQEGDRFWRDAKRAQRKARQEAAKDEATKQAMAKITPPAKLISGQVSIIDLVNDHYGIEGALYELGYIEAGGRWIAPESTTGSAGVTILRGDDGKERAFSHHEHDPCKGKACDAFDLFCIRRFDGDAKSAVNELGKELFPDHVKRNLEIWLEAQQASEDDLADTPLIEKHKDCGMPVVENLFTRGAHGIVFGKPGCGKTTVITYVAFCVATGHPVFGALRTKRGKVLYFDAEGNGEVQAMLDANKLFCGNAAPDVCIVNGAPDLRKTGAIQRICLEHPDVVMVVIDTIPAFFAANGVTNAAASSEVQPVLDKMRDLAQAMGACVVGIHHPPKGNSEDMRDSSAIEGSIAFACNVSTPDICDRSLVNFRVHKMRGAGAVTDRTYGLKTYNVQIMTDEQVSLHEKHLEDYFGTQTPLPTFTAPGNTVCMAAHSMAEQRVVLPWLGAAWPTPTMQDAARARSEATRDTNDLSVMQALKDGAETYQDLEKETQLSRKTLQNVIKRLSDAVIECPSEGQTKKFRLADYGLALLGTEQPQNDIRTLEDLA